MDEDDVRLDAADDGHASVSSPGAAGAETGLEGRGGEPEQAGDEGDEGQAASTSGGLEDVAGYTMPDAGSVAESVVESDEALRDIGEASFGPVPGLEVVIGVDDRVQITATSVFPWRVHASLRITANDGSRWIGTGWFCGPHTLITAGHCVFIKNSGVPNRDGWVRSITVIPGRNGAQQPFGSAVSTNFRTVSGWSNSGNQEYDYGAIILPTDLGSATGWLGIGAYSDATLLASIANISGYPGDKPAGTQWYHARKVTSVGSRKVFYDVDTAGGQSGSGVYRIADGRRVAIAIHAYGGGTANSGTRITTEVYNNLVAWKA
ncbi:trypsin-like serine peptidase [Agromyces sp. NPDC056523]|uniref:trypsin-like serine peptidase n=1 Tax=Agromyces sp. NPDC056523 TaxID=3345850 RepID=UPI00366C8007